MPCDFKLIQEKRGCFSSRGLTLIEILLVVSLVSLITLALYVSFANGLKVWERSRQLVLEEDMAIFLDKLSHDLRNTYTYSKVSAKGTSTRFVFPAIVHTMADPKMGLPEDAYIDQMGQVEYYFDTTDKSIYRRQANYSQGLKEKFQNSLRLASSIDKLDFQYHYLTDTGEKISDEVLEYMPFGVDVKIEFSDKLGKHVIRRFIDIPLKI